MNKHLLKIASPLVLLVLLALEGGAAPAQAAIPAPGPGPSFDAPFPLLPGVGATMPVLADFNLDGKADIAVTNQVTGTVSVLLAPTFSTILTIPTVPGNSLAQPVYLAVGDFNKDGKPDLVVVNRQDNSATVLKNTLTGSTLTFTTTRIPIPVPFGATGSQPAQVAVADVDGDGNLDFATANYLSNTIAVFFGDGTGITFQGHPTKLYPLSGAVSGTNPNSIVFTDLNRDGKPDIVVGANNGSQLFVLVNTGSATDPYAPNATFANPMPYTIGANPVAAAAADMNGDLSPDVVVSNNGGVNGAAVISILFGNGDGFLGTAPCLQGGCGAGKRLDIAGVGASPQGIVVGDVNGDSYADIAVVDDSHGTSDGLRIFLGNGLGCFGNTAPLISPCGTWAPTNWVPGTLPRGVGLGDVNGDGKPDLYVANTEAPGLTLFTNNLPGAAACAAVLAPPTCVTPRTPCVGMDVSISNVVPGGVAVRGYSLTLRLSSNLALCLPPSPVGGLPAAAFVKGDYLPGNPATRNTEQHVTLNADGSYTIDEVILDPPAPGGASCGPTTGAGKLFTVFVTSSSAGPTTGIGTVSVTGLVLRDCNNGPLTAFACPPGSQGTITIKTVPVAPPTALIVRQKRNGNVPPPAQTTDINVSWTWPTDPTSLPATTRADIWRAPFLGAPPSLVSGYPDYQGAPPAAPTLAVLYPVGPPVATAPWVKVGTVPGTQTPTFNDLKSNFPSRGYWYYVVVRVDECGTPSNILGFGCDALSGDNGTLNYHLGDVAGGGATCVGDDKCDVLDLSAILANFSTTRDVPIPSPIACMDFAPTSAALAIDQRVHAELGRPLRDRRIDQQEMFVLALNLGVVSSPQLAASPAAADHDELTLDSPARVNEGGAFKVAVRLKGAGDIHGIAAQLAWDHAVAEVSSVEPGELAGGQDGIVVAPEPGNVIAVVPGADRAGFLGDGVLATVNFRAKATGDPRVRIDKLDARDREMRQVLGSSGSPIAPRSNDFATVSPNPFQQRVMLEFSLATGGRAELAIYSIEGRRVKTVASGTRGAGVYRLSWDGTDERGRSVEPGVYFARLLTSSGRFSHTLVRIK